MLKQEFSTIVFSFLLSFSFVDLLHFFVLTNIVVNQEASTEAGVMSKMELVGVLKYAPDEIGAQDRGKIYMIKIN